MENGEISMMNEEAVLPQDLQALLNLEKDYKMASLQAEVVKLTLENVKLQLKLKYKLSDTDVVDSQSGKITRQ